MFRIIWGYIKFHSHYVKEPSSDLLFRDFTFLALVEQLEKDPWMFMKGKRKEPRVRGVTATRQLLLPKLEKLFERNLLCLCLMLKLNCIINRYP